MRSFTFNGVSSTAFFLTNSIKRELLPTVNYDTVRIGGRNGVIPFSSTLDGREFEIGVTLMGSSETDVRAKCRQIASWLYTQTEKVLTFSDEPNISYYAKIKGDLKLDELANMASTKIKFYASDPFGYGQTVAKSGASPNMVVNNAGTAPTYPIFTVTPSISVSVISLTNNLTGKYLYLSGNGSPFTGGRPIQIDMNKNYVKDVGNSNSLMPYVNIDTDFWSLEAGNNSIQFSSNLTVSESHVERFY